MDCWATLAHPALHVDATHLISTSPMRTPTPGKTLQPNQAPWRHLPPIPNWRPSRCEVPRHPLQSRVILNCSRECALLLIIENPCKWSQMTLPPPTPLSSQFLDDDVSHVEAQLAMASSSHCNVSLKKFWSAFSEHFLSAKALLT